VKEVAKGRGVHPLRFLQKLGFHELRLPLGLIFPDERRQQWFPPLRGGRAKTGRASFVRAVGRVKSVGRECLTYTRAKSKSPPCLCKECRDKDWAPSALCRGRAKMGRPCLLLRRGGSKAWDRNVRPTLAKSKSPPFGFAQGRLSRQGREEWGTRQPGFAELGAELGNVQF
jgi:hypothetical protein